MRKLTQTTLTLLAVFAVVAAGAGNAMAQSSYPLNTEADEHPDTYFEEDRLTIETHNRSTMGWLEYEGDNGELQDVQAHVNGTESGAEVSYRADQIADADLLQYPRMSSEDGNNTETWTNAGDWTTTSSISVTDTDGSTASGVESIEVATGGSLTDGASENAKYTTQSITNDAEKRYLQFVGNVDSLNSGAQLAVQVRDGDGDYVAAVVNSSRDATATDVIANQTASGVVYQEQLGQLSVQGNGDGSLDAVEELRIVATDGDVTATITGLNVQKKSRWDFGDERVLDTSTDESDDYTDETVYNRPAGGRINASSLQGMGDWASDATVNKLQYLDVRYALEDKPSAVNATISDSEQYPDYQLLDLTWNRTIPTAYDVTHGNLVLKTEQSLLSERYVQIRYAEGVGDKNASEVSSGSWIDLSGSLGDEGKVITADSTTQADTTYMVQIKGKLLPGQANNLEDVQTGGGGFWGSSGGGGNPFLSLYNWMAGGVVGLLTMLGLRRRAGA